MRLIALLALITVFGGCTTQSQRIAAVDACSAYNAAFASALQLREQGKLTTSQIDQVGKIDKTVTPICTSPKITTVPASVATATASLLSLGAKK